MLGTDAAEWKRWHDVLNDTKSVGSSGASNSVKKIDGFNVRLIEIDGET